MAWVPKVRIKCLYSKTLKCHVYIVYSQCGRYSECFYDDPTGALQHASEEYQARLDLEETKEILDRI